MMPDVDGFELAEQIHRHPDLAGTVVIMLSSADRQIDAARCRQAGVAGYLIKPVKPSELFDAIVTAVDPATRNARTAMAPRDRRSGDQYARAAATVAPTSGGGQRHQPDAGTKPATKERATPSRPPSTAGRLSRRLETQTFDAVLMDVQMPEMDGFEATGLIREKERATGDHIPIVAMTAHAMKGDRERCLAAGMDAYVSKPVRLVELKNALATVLPAAQLASECVDVDNTPGDTETPAASPRLRAARRRDPPALILDRKELLRRFGGREDRLRAIVQIFLDEAKVAHGGPEECHRGRRR